MRRGNSPGPADPGPVSGAFWEDRGTFRAGPGRGPRLSGRRQPGRARSCFAAPVPLPLLVLLLWVGGCEPEAPEPTHQKLRAELGLPPEVPIHRVTVGGRGATDWVLPSRIEVAQGDVVEFFLTEGRVNLIRFDPDGLQPAARDFLEATDQMESPPLVEAESRFVVSFEDAPPGEYPYVSGTHGDPARGVIVVRTP